MEVSKVPYFLVCHEPRPDRKPKPTEFAIRVDEVDQRLLGDNIDSHALCIREIEAFDKVASRTSKPPSIHRHSGVVPKSHA